MIEISETSESIATLFIIYFLLVPTLWLARILTRKNDDPFEAHFSLAYGLVGFGIVWALVLGIAFGTFSLYLAQHVEPDEMFPMMERVTMWMVFWIVFAGLSYFLLENVVLTLYSILKRRFFPKMFQELAANDHQRFEQRPDDPAAYDETKNQHTDCTFSATQHEDKGPG
jgi:membrane protein insertase Oxa1/YidC/SpoIIIJ